MRDLDVGCQAGLHTPVATEQGRPAAAATAVAARPCGMAAAQETDACLREGWWLHKARGSERELLLLLLRTRSIDDRKLMEAQSDSSLCSRPLASMTAKYWRITAATVPRRHSVFQHDPV